MFKRQTINLFNLIQRHSYATSAESVKLVLPSAIAEPPKYVLATLRSFPSLEPHSVVPVSSEFLNTPLRRDILWRALIKEADCARVGASNPPGRSDHKFSRRKLMKQKGNGRARVGDANSPIRINGARAHARTAPNDFTTELPKQLYANAFRVALSEYYRKGSLFIVGGEGDQVRQHDSFGLEIPTSDYHSLTQFVKSHQFDNLNLLFITSDYNKVENLSKAIYHYPSTRVDLKTPEELEVREILKANRVIIDKLALENLAVKYADKYL